MIKLEPQGFFGSGFVAGLHAEKIQTPFSHNPQAGIKMNASKIPLSFSACRLNPNPKLYYNLGSGRSAGALGD